MKLKRIALLLAAGLVAPALIGCSSGGGGGGDSAAAPAGRSRPQPPATPRAKKVLLLGIDGARPDAVALARTPNLDALKADGVYSDRVRGTDTTWSGSCWSTILHGVWRDKHGVIDNTFSGSNYAAYPDWFTHLEAFDPSLATVHITDWDGMYNNMPTGADQHIRTAGDAASVAEAISWLTNASADVDALYVYFAEPDHTGHSDGFHPTVPAYLAAIETVDQQIGQLLAAVRGRPTYADEDWLIVAVTDHGGTLSGHGRDDPECRTVFLLVSGPAVVQKGGAPHPDPSQVDVVSTLLSHMDVQIDPAWQLDGHVVGLVPPAVAPIVGYHTNLLEHPDAELDRGCSGVAPNTFLKQWIDVGKASAIRYGTPGFLLATDPGPLDRGENFFAGGAARLSSLVQRIDVSSLAADIDGPGGVDFALKGYIGGYGSENDSAEVTIRFLTGVRRSAEPMPDGKVSFFEGDTYCRFDPVADAVESGYPRAIAADFPGLSGFAGGAGNLDAVLNYGNGKIYFFKGDEYIRYDWASGQADAGYPRSIAGNWTGLEHFRGGARDLDAALDWGNGKVYFFKGDEYVRFDKAADRADAGYPLRISTVTWADLSVWPIGIDAACSWPADQNRAYFFKQGRYVRYRKDTDNLYDASYPRPIDASSWSGLTTWFGTGGTVESLGPVTSADRNNVSGLLERSLSGSVPTHTRSIEVEVLFRRASGNNNDGYADRLSLELDR